jgi:DNA-binding FadR family transcriptional regulator
LAIESGDPDRAWTASNAHLRTTHDFLISIVKKLGK